MSAARFFPVLSLALLAAPRAARSEPTRSASLSWVRLPGAESCISGPKLAALVERRLGKGAIVPMTGAEVGIEGRVARTAEGTWKATLVLAHRDGGVLGTRELASAAASCDAIEPELALVLAVMIDPDAALDTGPELAAAPTAAAPAGPAAAPAAPAGSAAPSIPIRTPSPAVAPVFPAPAPPRIPAAVGSPAAPWRVRLAAGPSLSFGLVPSVGAGGTLHLAVTPPRFWTFEAAALFTAPARTTTPDGVGGDFTLAVGRLSACPLSGVSEAWSFAACAGVELGGVRGRGLGLPVVLEQEQWVANAAIHGRAERRLFGPLFGGVRVGIGVPVVRTRFFYVDGDGAEREVFMSSPVAGAADLALGVELP